MSERVINVFRHRMWYMVASVVGAVSLILMSLFLALPNQIKAAGMMGDMMCIGLQCPCGKGPAKGPCDGVGAGKIGCPCMDDTNGFTSPGTGTSATPPKCKASAGEMPPMLPMLPMMMPMMMMMMPDMPQDCNNSGQNSGTVPPVPMVTIKAPNQSSNPADPVQYITVPATNTPPVKCPPNYNSGSTDAYGNTGAGAGVTPASGGAVSDLISSLLGGNDGSSNGGSGTGSSGSGEGSATSSGNKTPRGVFGDILFATGMATVLEINQDQSHNAASAGFYGLNSPGATGKQLVSALCRTRPWSNSYLSFIVPPTFFDNLCTLRGFGAGAKSSANGNGKTGGTVTSSGLYIPTPMAVIPGGLTDLPVTKSDAPTKKPVSPKTPLATDIWATPASVASGAKTTIFWNTSGVTDCTVASTDVTFSYTSLTGHAATPSITKPTSFTLTCTTDGGAKVTSHVTVGITQ